MYTQDDYIEIAIRTNDRIASLFAVPDANTLPPLTSGLVRMVLDIAAEYAAEQQPAGHSQELRAQPSGGLLVDSNGALALAATNDHAARSGRSGLGADEYRALVLSEIRRIAGPDGTWVSLADFDAARTTQLPTGSGVTKRLKCRWTDVVQEALGDRCAPPDRAQRMLRARSLTRQAQEKETPAQEATFRPSAQAASILGPEHVVVTPYANDNGATHGSGPRA